MEEDNNEEGMENMTKTNVKYPKPELKRIKISYCLEGENLDRFRKVKKRLGLNNSSIGKIAMLKFLERDEPIY
jgi:hypothetical protein